MSSLSLSDIGSAANTQGLDTSEAGRFVRTIRLSFQIDAHADRVIVAPGTVLHTQFSTRDVNALSANAPERATLSIRNSHLAVTLPVARRFRSVALKSPVDGDSIAAFRFDGPVVSEDPVKVASHSGSSAFVNVTDAALILRRRNGNDFALGTNSLDAVTLRYAPQNPRLAIRLAGDPGPGLPLPARTDADGLPIFPNSAHHGDALRSALQALIDGLDTPLPPVLDLDLILISDQPCNARVSNLNVGLIFETSALPDKTVLKFDATSPPSQSLALSLPIPSLISSGTVTVTVSGVAPNAAQQSAPMQPLPAAMGTGVDILDGVPVAGQIPIANATTVAGADCVLAARGGPATVKAILHADVDGLPADAIAESVPVDISRATPSAIRFDFPATSLPAGAIWLIVSIIEGRAVAMLGGTGRIAIGSANGFSSLTTHPPNQSLALALRPLATPVSTVPPGGPSLQIGSATQIALPTSGTTQIDLTPYSSVLATQPNLAVTSNAQAVVSIDPPLVQYTTP